MKQSVAVKEDECRISKENQVLFSKLSIWGIIYNPLVILGTEVDGVLLVR